jgi:hypothetical protein
MPAESMFERVSDAIITIFNAEFAAEGYVMIADNLHEALGRYRVDVGIAPVEDRAMSNNRMVQETWVEVKFYHLWTEEISPDTQVNPITITNYAERLRDALRVGQSVFASDGSVWYFDVDRVQYPNDPTGNKSRFVMTIRAFGNNTNLIETTA